MATSGEEGEGAMRPWARERTPGPGSARRDAGSTATRKPAIRKRRGRARSRRFVIRSMYQKSIGGRKGSEGKEAGGGGPRGGGGPARPVRAEGAGSALHLRAGASPPNRACSVPPGSWTRKVGVHLIPYFCIRGVGLSQKHRLRTGMKRSRRNRCTFSSEYGPVFIRAQTVQSSKPKSWKTGLPGCFALSNTAPKSVSHWIPAIVPLLAPNVDCVFPARSKRGLVSSRCQQAQPGITRSGLWSEEEIASSGNGS